MQDLKDQGEIHTISFLLIVLYFCLSCQDIAIDSWACEMLYPDLEAFAGPVHSIGVSLGGVLGTSVFIALNSLEFCKMWIYPKDSFL